MVYVFLFWFLLLKKEEEEKKGKNRFIWIWIEVLHRVQLLYFLSQFLIFNFNFLIPFNYFSTFLYLIVDTENCFFQTFLNHLLR